MNVKGMTLEYRNGHTDLHKLISEGRIRACCSLPSKSVLRLLSSPESQRRARKA